MLLCQRYIELNPVRAGIVELPGETAWYLYEALTISTLRTIMEPQRNQHNIKGGQAMPSITVKNIPDHAYKILKQTATAHRRSINNEIIRLIEKATISKQFSPEQHLNAARQSRAKTKGFLLTPEILQETKEKGRS